MDARPLDARPTDVKPHPLLVEARRSDPTGLVTEPVWLLETETGWSLLWGPDDDSWADHDPVLRIKDPGEHEPWDVVLALWNRYRDLSDLEKALVVSTLNARAVDVDRSRLADRLDLPPSDPLFDAMRSVVELPEPLQERLHEGSLGLRLIRYLRELPGDMQDWVTRALAEGTLRLSVQEMRQLGEAARRLPEAKRSEWTQQAEACTSGDNPAKTGEKLMSLTRKLAFPRTRERKEQFESTLETIDPDGRITVTPPDNFEGDYLDFRFRCRRNEDLTKLAEELKECERLLEHL